MVCNDILIDRMKCIKTVLLVHTISIAFGRRTSKFCNQVFFFFIICIRVAIKAKPRRNAIDTNMFSISRHTNGDSILTFGIRPAYANNLMDTNLPGKKKKKQ